MANKGGAILESAIPEHLRVERTVPPKMSADYEPAFPAYCARLPEKIKDVIMAIIGAQHINETKSSRFPQILSFIENNIDSKPQHWELASVIDAQGAYNEVVIAYWGNLASYKDWKTSSGFTPWWQSLDPEKETNGWFLEVFVPSADRLETLYSDLMKGDEPEGSGHMNCGMSDMIREHVYWGSMRDRLPISQTDKLVGEAAPSFDRCNSTKTRIRVPGRTNLAVIRSGQDWSRTAPDERKLYLETMHPVLIKGMDFLRDNGDEVGCYNCRFMEVLNSETMKSGTDQTFGLAYFDNLASLEGWSKDHQTHLNIFGGFLKYVKKLNFQTTLHLFHEVLVLKPEQQYFEYVGCHQGTGMLRELRAAI